MAPGDDEDRVHQARCLTADGDKHFAWLHHVVQAYHWLDVYVRVHSPVHVQIEDPKDATFDLPRHLLVEVSNFGAKVFEQKAVTFDVTVHYKLEGGIHREPFALDDSRHRLHGFEANVDDARNIGGPKGLVPSCCWIVPAMAR